MSFKARENRHGFYRCQRAPNAVAINTWKLANQDVWSIYLSPCLAPLTVPSRSSKAGKKYGTSEGHAAWEALNETCNSHTKEGKRACQEKLVNTTTRPGQNADELLFVLDRCCDLLEETGQTMHDEGYENIIVQARPVQ